MNPFMPSLSRAVVLVTALSLFATPAFAKSIPIVVDHYLPDPRPDAPVKFGVPFPRGELKVAEAGNVRVVDGNGNVVPHQALVTATWNPDGSDGVRWLLVDAAVNVGKTYKLVFNESAATTNLPPVATLTNDLIQIDTGPIRGTIPAKGGNWFAGLNTLGIPMVVKRDGGGPMDFSGLYVEHEKKGIFRADLDPDATAVLEENGPVRATLKCDGWYANAAGEKFCRYSVRMHFFRGRPDIKLEHTFIFTGLSAADRLRSVSLQFQRANGDVAKRMRGMAGGDDLLDTRGLQDITGNGFFLQDQSERGRFDCIRASGSVTNFIKIADKGGGWLTTLGTEGMSVAIRDAWQQFPWELEMDGGAVRAHLWPRHGRLLDLSWDGFWSQLTERQKLFHAKQKPHKEQNLDEWLARLKKANATGAAKTHEIWMSFVGAEYEKYRPVTFGAYGGLAREVAYPVIAYADPAWTCNTRALDFLPQWPKDMKLFPDEENFLQSLFTMVQDATAANNFYGWWDWGAYHQHLYVGPRVPRFGTYADDAGMEVWHRARPKSHYGWGGLPWVQYMRSGQRDWLRYAQTYTLYSADRAHAHHTGHGYVAGAEFHYDNSEVPWMGGRQHEPGGKDFRSELQREGDYMHLFTPGGNILSSNLQGKDDYVYQYWLTGDRRALDVLKSWGEMVLEANAKGAKWGTWKPGFANGNDIRNAGMQLERVTLLYMATWDPRYLELAKHIASAFLPLDTPEKVAEAQMRGNRSATGWAYQGMWFYWNVTKDETFKKAFLAFLERSRDWDASFDTSYSPIRAANYGYMLTGDELYLNLARASVDDMVSTGVSPWTFLPSWKMHVNPMPRFLGTMATAPKAWRDANLPTHERRRTLTFRYAQWKNNPHYGATRVFFREAADREWSFDATFSWGGKIALLRPDGTTAVEKVVDHHTHKLVRFTVPKDGQSGTYTLTCLEPSEEFSKVSSPEYQAYARVVRRDLPMVVEAGGPGKSNPVTGRALYFQVPAKVTNAKVSVGDFDRKREYRVEEVGGPWRMSSRDQVPDESGGVHFDIPASDKARKFGLHFVSAPDVHVDPFRSRPQWVRFENLPPHIAANPEDWFEPKPPATAEGQ